MPVGLTANMTVSSVNQQAGAILQNLVAALDQVNEMQTFLSWYGSGGLTGLGFTSGDAALLISAFTDAAKIYGIFHGTQTQSTTYDFTTFVKQLIASGIH